MTLALLSLGSLLSVAGCGRQSEGNESTDCKGISDCQNLSPLRRLTNVEYRNTLRDLFPQVTLPELEFLNENLVDGFENNAEAQNLSEDLVTSYRKVAFQVADAVTAEKAKVLPPNCDLATQGESCMQAFVEGFLPKAYRRPVSDVQRTSLLGFYSERASALGPEAAFRDVLRVVLQSPYFIYRVERGGSEAEGLSPELLSSYEIANRLSYFLWASMPDEALFAAASAGGLHSPEEREAQAKRMLEDERAKAMIVDFHRQWLDLDRILHVETDKNREIHPQYDGMLRAAMREESLRFIRHHLIEGSGTLSSLFLGRQSWVNADLARLYGVAPPEGAPWGLVEFDAAERAGFLTQANFLASRSGPVHPSPVGRGVFVLRRVLCFDIPAPPADVVTAVRDGDKADAAGTNRERFEAHSTNPRCASCHQYIDGVGFGFESYDALGRHRQQDNGRPVDDSSELRGTDVNGAFRGAIELSNRLASSPQVQRCNTLHWFRYAFGRSERPGDAPLVDALNQTYGDAGQKIRDLLVALVRNDAFIARKAPPALP